MEQHSPIHPLNVNKPHAAEHMLHSSSVFQKNCIFWDMKSRRNLQMFWRKQLALFPPQTWRNLPPLTHGRKKKCVIKKKTALFTDNAVRTSNIIQRLRIPQISLP